MFLEWRIVFWGTKAGLVLSASRSRDDYETLSPLDSFVIYYIKTETGFSTKKINRVLKKIVGKIWKQLTPAARLKITRATQSKFTVSVAAVVVNERGEVLLLDHVLRPFSNWGIPGGFINVGEEPEKALLRELREETGLELKNIRLLRVRTHQRHVEILYRAEASGAPEALSPEINQARWFKIEDIPEEMSDGQKSDAREFINEKKI